MKIDANNCESATEKSQQHKQQQQTANTASYNNNNNENDTSKGTAAAPATKTTTTITTKMTDERNTNNYNNNNINNNNNNNNKNNNNDRIVVEAAKILLKNGLNGTNTTAAATLLTAAAAAAATTINLPPPPPPPPTSTSKSTNTSSALFPAQTTAFVAATSIGCSINNGQSSKALGNTTATSNPQQRSATATKTKKAMAAATATSTTNEFLSTTERLISGTSPSAITGGGGSGDSIKIDNVGVIDYTVNTNNTASNLNLTASSNNSKTNNSSNNDIGRHPISSTGQGFGGRLQFFKDGKFILELARSKDGEKGGWVSVPRKLFRAPLSATSSTITPTSTTSTTYPKNESSTSLSFSDDNSSIQSSPWQRDHCWKQSAPRYGISKEMSLYYQRSKQLTLTKIGLQTSRKKRRRPFDNTSTTSWESAFTPLDRKDLSSQFQSKEKLSNNDQGIIPESGSKSGKSDTENNSEDDTCSTSSSSTLTGTDCIDGVVTTKKTSKTNSVSADLLPAETIKIDMDVSKSGINNENLNSVSDCSKQAPVERMNTSEDERSGDVSMAISTEEEEDQSSKKLFNGDAKADKVLLASPPSSSSLGKVLTTEVTTSNAGAGEKRLKKLKTRAKLITIIQKLIDRVPTAVHSYLSKTPQHLMSGNSGGATFNQNNSMIHKISPPSSSTSSVATSRLVELQYHQQHVSPRKRILREFEKVSLEDTGPIAVGGKRSRAKGNTATSGAKSSPQRVQSLGCAVLTSTSTSTASTSTATNGGLNKNASKSATPAPPTSSTPTRLYSSYSIHSLLGGGNSSTSNASAATSGKQAIISNINYQQHQQQQQHSFTDPSYLRAMLASPQSPENNGAGGKSPSSSSTNKKRSPPYSSPLYDNHSRSPTVSTHIINDYGRRSPRATPPESNYKIRFAADQTTATSSSASLLQQQQQQQQHVQQQSFYSPYMMSPKYVPAPQTSMSPNSINNSNASRSPRHSSAFSAHIPSSTNASASASVNSIPTRELSPPRSATASPRETTPRTVPKKTASIRRQFASPNNTTSLNERADEQQQQHHQQQQQQQQQERKTHLTTNSTGTAHHQLSYQRASPNPHAAHMSAAASPLHYYMYAPNTAGSSSSNAVGSTSVGSTSAAAQANAAAAAAAAAGAYIPTVIPPSYYHPYISTLAALRHNPMWMHHYPGTTPGVMPPHNPVSSQAASRLSSPFHNFPYNGVGAAAVAAAAAAASGFGGPIPQSHLSQVGLAHQMSAPSAIHHHASGAYVGGASHSPKLTDENSIKTITKQTTAPSIYPSSIKDEHSSDVPLNLSKH